MNNQGHSVKRVNNVKFEEFAKIFKIITRRLWGTKVYVESSSYLMLKAQNHQMSCCYDVCIYDNVVKNVKLQ